jgi:copper(I)-binding protein
MTKPLRFVCAAALTVVSLMNPAHAQVTVSDAWVRATVPQQKATGMFASVVSAKGGKVVSASSPVADVVEIHEMAMENNVMRMRAIPALELPKPGGFHVMLMGLKQQVKEGDSVPVTLVIEGKDGKRENVEVKAAARATNSAGGGHHQGGHRH